MSWNPFKKKTPETNQVEPLHNHIDALKEVILSRQDLINRLNAVMDGPSASIDGFIEEVVTISQEEGLPFTSQEFVAQAKASGHSLPAVCMAYFGGGMGL